MTDSTPQDPSPADAELTAAIERQLPALRAYIRNRMSDALAARETSVDLVQSVCGEFARSAEGFAYQGDEALRAWLFRTAVHKILEKARRQARERASLEGMVEQGSEDEVDALTPSRVLMANEQVNRLRDALDQMEASDREIIELIRLGGLTHAEAANRLGISSEASRARLRRALIRLAAVLEPGDDSP